MPRALISVADKRGLKELASALVEANYEIVSSAGTARELAALGITCISISDITGFPEIMDGRVKTLHPHVHGAILARRDQDTDTLQTHGITPIDLVIVNLYPFAKTLEQHPDNHALLVENIDIGGPALLRAAAKNHRWVSAVVDPDDYPEIMQSLASGGPDQDMRKRMAAKTFAYVSGYDNLIASYLAADKKTLSLYAPHAQTLRYGENPHQQGVLYHFDKVNGWGGATQYQGKELSYNNIVDSDAAWRCVQEFSTPTCVIVKHANPCGVASKDNLLDAYKCAFAADSESAFGGVIAFTGECDSALASKIIETQFAEVIIAPTFTADALDVFAAKPKLRLVSLATARATGMLKSISGGVLWQSNDTQGFDPASLRVVSGAQADCPIHDLQFAWLVVKHVKSNAIVVTTGTHTIGVGVGQTSRVKALKQALAQARDNGFATEGSILASDAFFPFSDSVEIAAEYGVAWIIQPGGSLRDEEVIEAAKKHHVGMVFTGQRYFYH